MFSLNKIVFDQSELDLIDQSYNGDFKSIWKIDTQDNGLEIDVFKLYKRKEDEYIVYEKSSPRYYGTLDDCLAYIHHWL